MHRPADRKTKRFICETNLFLKNLFTGLDDLPPAARFIPVPRPLLRLALPLLEAVDELAHGVVGAGADI